MVAEQVELHAGGGVGVAAGGHAGRQHAGHSCGLWAAGGGGGGMLLFQVLCRRLPQLADSCCIDTRPADSPPGAALLNPESDPPGPPASAPSSAGRAAAAWRRPAGRRGQPAAGRCADRLLRQPDHRQHICHRGGPGVLSTACLLQKEGRASTTHCIPLLRCPLLVVELGGHHPRHSRLTPACPASATPSARPHLPPLRSTDRQAGRGHPGKLPGLLLRDCVHGRRHPAGADPVRLDHLGPLGCCSQRSAGAGTHGTPPPRPRRTPAPRVPLR